MSRPLRTALAMSNRLNDPEFLKSLAGHFDGKKEIVPLLERIAAVRSDPTLAAPEVFDFESFPGTNLVADFFDNPSSESRSQGLYENACLDSDLLLAEAACCAEILDVRQENSIRAPKSCRQRLYAIAEDSDEPVRPAESARFSRSVSPETVTRDFSHWSEEPAESAAAYPFYRDELAEEHVAPRRTNDDSEARSILSKQTLSKQKKEIGPSKRKGSFLEGFLLTLLILALLIWFFPIARSRMENPKPISDSDKSIVSSQPESTVPKSSDSSDMWQPLKLQVPEDSANAPNHYRRAALTIPERHNDVFGRK